MRKYTPISKRKCNTLHKWRGARNSAVSGSHWLLSAVNQSGLSIALARSCLATHIQKGLAALDHLRCSASWSHDVTSCQSCVSATIEPVGRCGQFRRQFAGELMKLYPVRAQTTLYCVTQPAFCMHGELQWSVNNLLSHDDDRLRNKPVSHPYF